MKKNDFISMTFASLSFLAPFASLAADDAAPPMERDLTQILVMFGIAIAFFYFILWRPEQKKRKALEEQRSSLKKGDKVNAMGIIGTISKIEEATVIVKMVDGSKIEFLKAAITEVLQPGSEEEKE